MQFPSTNMSLRAIVNFYGNPPIIDFNYLRQGRIYYSSPTDFSSALNVVVTAPTDSIDLEQFQGKYIEATGPLASQNATATGTNIQGEVEFDSATMTIRGPNISAITFNFNVYSQHQGAAISSGTNNPVVQVFGNDFTVPVYQDGTTGTKTVTFVQGTTKFRISASVNASSNLGNQVSVSGSWTYNVREDGLGVIGPL